MKLIDCTDSAICSGTVFRFKGKYPFCEEYADFMLCDYPHGYPDCSPFALYCISGYHAGSLEYVLPCEAKCEKSHGIKKDWIVKNWNTHIYAECDVSEVEIIKISAHERYISPKPGGPTALR